MKDIVFNIDTLAKTLGVTKTTLRNYDKDGILTPNRTITNRRYYTLNDLEKGKIILFITRNLLLDIGAVKLFFAMIEKEKIKPENQLEYLKEIALKAGFSKEIQEKNIKKAENRGSKSKTLNKNAN